MKVVHSRTFKSGNSEAVRLPKEFAFGLGTAVTIERENDEVRIRPVKTGSMAELVARLREMPGDNGWERPPVDIPERAIW